MIGAIVICLGLIVMRLRVIYIYIYIYSIFSNICYLFSDIHDRDYDAYNRNISNIMRV